MTSVVSQDYWDRFWEESGARSLAYREDTILFKELFARYLTPGGSCFEVGCYPGNFLIYLAKTFGYTVSGIDATPLVSKWMPGHMARNSVHVGSLVEGDFFTFEPAEQFDVVCSFGFVEHFTDVEAVIERHARLVKPGGMLVISCPNFRRLQYVAHRLLDRPNLERHVLPAMDLSRWRAALIAAQMTVVHEGFYRTADFWIDSPPRTLANVWMSRQLGRLARCVDKFVDWPNRWTSPYMISFSRKPVSGGN